jgi:hypothetical protein
VESGGCIKVKFNFSQLCHLRYQTQRLTKNEYSVSIIAVYRIGKYFNNRTGIGEEALVRQWNIAIEISI